MFIMNYTLIYPMGSGKEGEMEVIFQEFPPRIFEGYLKRVILLRFRMIPNSSSDHVGCPLE